MNDCVCGFNPPDDPNPDCERCQLVTEVTRLEGLNKMWVGIKADRDERIEERDEARAIARRLYEWMKGMFRVPFPEADAEFVANAPWLEDE